MVVEEGELVVGMIEEVVVIHLMIMMLVTTMASKVEEGM